MLETEKAWLAGFIDGEGTITLYPRNKRRGCLPIVQIVNSNLTILESIRDMLGFGVMSRHVYETENWKGSYTLSIRARSEVSVILEWVMPYLRLKKEQAELLKIYCDEHIPNKSATEIELEIAHEVQTLNRVGKKNAFL